MDIETLATRMDKRFDKIEEKQDVTNGRLGKLEGWKKYSEGVSAGQGGSWHLIFGIGGLLIGAGGVVATLALTFGGA